MSDTDKVFFWFTSCSLLFHDCPTILKVQSATYRTTVDSRNLGSRPCITLAGPAYDYFNINWAFWGFPHSLNSCLHSLVCLSAEFSCEVLLSKTDMKLTRQDDPHVNILDKIDHPLHRVCVSSACIGPDFFILKRYFQQTDFELVVSNGGISGEWRWWNFQQT